MDLKGVVRQIIPPNSVGRKDPVERAIRSEMTQEREGNGQASFGSGQEHREPMEDEQFQKAIEHLRAHAVVKDNNLQLTVEGEVGHRFIILSEADGKVIRRIPELELWTLQYVKDNEKGQFLSKAA